MHTQNSYASIDLDSANTIQRTAKQLIGKAGFTASDRYDIEQELMLDLWQRMKSFDSARGKQRSFINQVISKRVSKLLAFQFASSKGRNCKHIPFDDISFCNDERFACDKQAQNELRLDINKVVAALPEDLQMLCQQLQVLNMTELAKHTGIPRATLYWRVGNIRKAFCAAGLNAYI